MKKITDIIFDRFRGAQRMKDRETFRREYEGKVYEYDHYTAFGSALSHICSKK